MPYKTPVRKIRPLPKILLISAHKIIGGRAILSNNNKKKERTVINTKFMAMLITAHQQLHINYVSNQETVNFNFLMKNKKLTYKQ